MPSIVLPSREETRNRQIVARLGENKNGRIGGTSSWKKTRTCYDKERQEIEWEEEREQREREKGKMNSLGVIFSHWKGTRQ